MCTDKRPCYIRLAKNSPSTHSPSEERWRCDYLSPLAHIKRFYESGGPASKGSTTEGAALGYAVAYFLAVWRAMVLGLLIGSGVQALLPRQWLARTLRKAGFGSSTVAAAVAVPSMMCTCCAAPVAVGLRKCKASTGAAVAYLVGNPMLNPATIVFIGYQPSWRLGE